MHESNADEQGRDPSSGKDDEKAEGWFRFGDEPEGPAPAVDERHRDAATKASAADAASDGDAPRKAAGTPTATDSPARGTAEPAASSSEPAAAAEEPEERIQPFVVSATPGGVDPDEKAAADEAVITSVGGGRGFGLVGALTVVLAIFGLGLFAMTGPRTADAEGAAGGGDWMSDITAATDRAAAEGKPLLVHFTADWCPPCQAMRDTVFASAEVQDRLAAQFITVRVDLTERGGPNNAVAAQFGVQSIPDHQVYHPSGWQMGRFGYASSPREFLARLDRIDD